MMQRFWDGVGAQLRSPRGQWGRITGWAMRLANQRVNALAVAALAPRAGENLLEIGCGPGHGLQLLLDSHSQAKVTGMDHSPVMLAQAAARNRAAVESGRLRLLAGDFAHLPMEEGSVDAILAVNVAYFMRDATALAEAHRVLKPGGRIVIYVTHAQSMRGWRFAREHSHRLFENGDLAGLLRAAGFPQTAIVISTVNAGFSIAGLMAEATA